MRRVGCLLLALAAAAALLTGCAPEEHEEIIFAMDTVMQLQAWGDGAEDALTRAVQRINELDRTLSVVNENSDIWAINHGQGAVEVSPDTLHLVELGLELWRDTGGALNIAMYPVVRAWGFTTGEYRVVPEPERAELLEYTDLGRLELDEAAGTVTLPEGMELDLGSLGKGYAGDQVMDILRGSGVTSAIVNLGGNVQALGSQSDGSPWRVGIQDPEDESAYLAVLEISDLAVVTSGGYQRYFEEDGQTYWHIMDPATGAPADSGLISATAVGASGALCDGLSTALFVMGADAAADFWRGWEDFEFVLVDQAGTIWVSEGLEDSFSLAQGYEDRTVEVVRR